MNILCVDDDPLILEMLLMVLQQNSNLTIKTAESADSARAVLKEGFVPDLLVLDQEMPGQHGLDLLGSLKSQPQYQHVIAIMLTAATNPHLLDKAQSLGVQCYLVKPISPSVLLNEVKSLMPSK